MTTAVAAAVLQALDRAQWRAWLTAHADSATEVWLVIEHRGGSATGISHREAVEEALCFGWIDSHTRKHGPGTWRQRFTPRNPRSAWSKVNRQLVEQLTAQGLMTPRGDAAVALAKQTGTWEMLADAQDGLVPDDLREQLATDPVALANFEAFPRSARRAVLEWIARAKRPETRQRRIARTAECAARGTRP